LSVLIYIAVAIRVAIINIAIAVAACKLIVASMLIAINIIIK
jgi:hypothetical protein